MNYKNQIVSHTTTLLVAVVLLSGCAHSLVVKNLDSYRGFGVTQLDRPMGIGIVTDAENPDERRLLDGIAFALGQYSAQVVMPYFPNSNKPIDVVAHMEIETAHNGSGWNYLVTFPGFLILAPAWNGYIYEVKYTINCTLTKGTGSETIDQFKIPIALDIRHAGINRTWTGGCDVLATLGAASLIGGFVFISYDNSVTPLVNEKIERPIGKYIAQEIVKRINASGKVSQIIIPKVNTELAETSNTSPAPHG